MPYFNDLAITPAKALKAAALGVLAAQFAGQADAQTPKKVTGNFLQNLTKGSLERYSQTPYAPALDPPQAVIPTQQLSEENLFGAGTEDIANSVAQLHSRKMLRRRRALPPAPPVAPYVDPQGNNIETMPQKVREHQNFAVAIPGKKTVVKPINGTFVSEEQNTIEVVKYLFGLIYDTFTSPHKRSQCPPHSGDPLCREHIQRDINRFQALNEFLSTIYHCNPVQKNNLAEELNQENIDWNSVYNPKKPQEYKGAFVSWNSRVYPLSFEVTKDNIPEVMHMIFLANPKAIEPNEKIAPVIEIHGNQNPVLSSIEATVGNLFAVDQNGACIILKEDKEFIINFIKKFEKSKKDFNIGVGVGIGLGVPIFILAIFALCHHKCK